ncbi:hypothetical protein EYF80_040111 [Liparis tanakae]|uniref:Uncharacterized protein n=1 Tax=Liparis tanakae TaxID=230148 RepID=A0A4Z2G8R0_9TELE|nr:hypothetical protein EYF80_040111 [Liparis tanakae]
MNVLWDGGLPSTRGRHAPDAPVALFCAVVLQLRDDGDQLLEAKDVSAVQAIVHHFVPVVLSAGGVSKIDHPHVHQRPTGAAIARRGGSAMKAECTRYFALLLLHFGFGLHLLTVILFFFVFFVREAVLGAFLVRRSVVDDEQGAGVEAIGLTGLQGGLQLSEPAQHRREEFTQ